MRIRVLGGYGADFCSIEQGDEVKQARGKRYNPTGFLINRSVALDAGTLSGALPLEELTAIRAVFLTHSHLDHVQSLAYFSESLFGRIDRPVEIFGLLESIQALKEHLFNNRLWPDFTRIPTAETPILRYRTIHAREPITVEGLTFTPIPVNHLVPSVGYIIEDKDAAVVFSGDTYKTEEIWEKASDLPHLKAAFIESSFPDQLGQLAHDSGHLTPSLVCQEFSKIKRPDLSLYVYHMKPAYLESIRKEFDILGRGMLIDDGQIFEF
ncbi:MAG: 3',5'-cyclic-nucleotide phosphodiesterase [Nitrospirota bacterium]